MLSSAVPHPSASPASQAVLRGQQASCILPLRRQVWDSLGGVGSLPLPVPGRDLRLKHPLIKTPEALPASRCLSVVSLGHGKDYRLKGQFEKVSMMWPS